MNARPASPRRPRSGPQRDEKVAECAEGQKIAPDASSEHHEALTQRIYIPGFPPVKMLRALSANGSHGHWSQTAGWRKDAALWVTVAARCQMLRPMPGRVRLHFVWTFPERRRRDIDNLIGNGVTKGAIDALVTGKWIEADDSEHVVSISAEVHVEYLQRRLEIVLEPLPAPQRAAADEQGEGGCEKR
jgi:Holliday junction resolvase RusA-like endonuclease